MLELARSRLMLVGIPYFLCGLMEVGTALNRSIGYSLNSLIITLFGSCAFRVVWIYTVFAMYKYIEVLYLVYPVSWIVTSSVLFGVFFVCYKKAKRAELI